MNCVHCKKKLPSHRRFLSTIIDQRVSGKQIKLVAYEDDCYQCAINKLKEWLKNHNMNYDRSFKLEFWIDKFPEHEELIRSRHKGKGSLGYYLKSGKTKKDYVDKNKKLSVGIDVLKLNGHSILEIESIRSRHKKASLITEKTLIDKYGEDDGKKAWKERIIRAKQTTCWGKLYWLNKGYNEIEATDILHKFQDRGSIQYFQTKYGNIEGKKIWKKISKSKAVTLDNYISKYGDIDGRIKFKLFIDNMLHGISGMELDFSDQLLDKLDITNKIYCKFNQYVFGITNEMSKKFQLNKKAIVVDFCIPSLKKVIEFNGDAFHANPEVYKDNEFPSFYVPQLSSKD